MRGGPHSNLISSQPNLRNDHNGTLKSDQLLDETERKVLIKRTKSFWRFGRSNSEEVLEGMAMWKHRDLVDVYEDKNVEVGKHEIVTIMNPPKPQERKNYSRRAASERSNDSDRTINAKQFEQSEEIYGTNNIEPPKRRTPSFKVQQHQKLSLPTRRESISRNDIDDFDDTSRRSPIDDQFYEDDGDGLMRTVNRKSILQQYVDSTVETDSESEDITSDDPYDCIVVDDHTTAKKQKKQQQLQQQLQKQRESESQARKEKYPNVAEIGKKLEKLSKASKYNQDSREKNDEIRRDEYRSSMNNKINKMTAYNNERNLERSPEIDPEEEIKVRRYNVANRNSQIRSPSPAQRHSFKTFGRQEEKASQSEPEMFVKPRHFEKKYQESDKEEKRSPTERRDKLNYYQERREEYPDENEKRQFLPRTKLLKTNMQTVMKFEHEIGIIDYDEALRNKMKKAEYEDIPNNGNVYGPWYDLWGLDATVKK